MEKKVEKLGKGLCCWILKPGPVRSIEDYCAEETPWAYEKDDDGYRRRKYQTFCAEHEPLARQQEAEEEEALLRQQEEEENS